MRVLSSVLRLSRILPIVAAITAASVLPALAQTNVATTQMSPADVAFVTTMLQVSRAQIEKAKLAEERTNDANAKIAAEGTIADWCAFRAHLAMIAAAARVPSPVAFSAAQEAMLARLQHAPSAQVMSELAQVERIGNQTALAQMRVTGSTSNPQIGQFIAYARPMVTADLQVTTADDVAIRSGPYGWGPPKASGDAWPARIVTGAFGWSTGTKTSDQKWPGVIRTGPFAWK